MITDKMYVNLRNPNKYMEVRRYSCGHYCFKQFMPYCIPEIGRNYMCCSFKRMNVGTWNRITKSTLDEILQDYTETNKVSYYNFYAKIGGQSYED